MTKIRKKLLEWRLESLSNIVQGTTRVTQLSYLVKSGKEKQRTGLTWHPSRFAILALMEVYDCHLTRAVYRVEGAGFHVTIWGWWSALWTGGGWQTGPRNYFLSLWDLTGLLSFQPGTGLEIRAEQLWEEPGQKSILLYEWRLRKQLRELDQSLYVTSCREN